MPSPLSVDASTGDCQGGLACLIPAALSPAHMSLLHQSRSVVHAVFCSSLAPATVEVAPIASVFVLGGTSPRLCHHHLCLAQSVYLMCFCLSVGASLHPVHSMTIACLDWLDLTRLREPLLGSAFSLSLCFVGHI